MSPTRLAASTAALAVGLVLGLAPSTSVAAAPAAEAASECSPEPWHIASHEIVDEYSQVVAYFMVELADSPDGTEVCTWIAPAGNRVDQVNWMYQAIVSDDGTTIDLEETTEGLSQLLGPVPWYYADRCIGKIGTPNSDYIQSVEVPCYAPG